MSVSLADLFNAPREYEWQGKTYKFREPTLIECAQWQRWLEGEALAKAAAATNIPEDDRRRLLRDVSADIASQRYAWGGEECVRTMTTPNGIAMFLSIICGPEGLTYRQAQEMVQHNVLEFARNLKLIVEEAEHDPEKKAELRRHLKERGFPQDFLSTSLSDSPTTHSEAPATSPQSAT